MNDRIAKEKLNIFLLIDASTSMRGKRIAQVNAAIKDIRKYLLDLQKENAAVDFYLTLIPFATEASFYDGAKECAISSFRYDGIRCGGFSNLDQAYELLEGLLHKERNGGIMPDFGGAAPIMLLLTDGHPTGKAHLTSLKKLEKLPWFQAALRYGVAIELDDARTIKVLSSFVGSNGDVVYCYDSSLLKRIIKVIVVTASKVKSQTANVGSSPCKAPLQTLQQVIAEELSDTEDWEW